MKCSQHPTQRYLSSYVFELLSPTFNKCDQDTQQRFYFLPFRRRYRSPRGWAGGRVLGSCNYRKRSLRSSSGVRGCLLREVVVVRHGEDSSRFECYPVVNCSRICQYIEVAAWSGERAMGQPARSIS